MPKPQVPIKITSFQFNCCNPFFAVKLLLLALFIQGCVPQRQIVYVQSPADKKAEHEYTAGAKRTVLIQPNDVLYINISSADPLTYNLFSQERLNYTSITESSLAVLGFTVNDSGEVQLPVVGKIRLKGLNIADATDTIRLKVKSVISNPLVSVRFINNTITVLGEVAHPGSYTYASEQITIFKALGLAGDINEYGNRREVVLVREENKIIHKYTVDITKDNLFTSNFYYLRPNDVLYIAPLKRRRLGITAIPYELFISLVTSVFLVMYYVKVP